MKSPCKGEDVFSFWESTSKLFVSCIYELYRYTYWLYLLIFAKNYRSRSLKTCFCWLYPYCGSVREICWNIQGTTIKKAIGDIGVNIHLTERGLTLPETNILAPENWCLEDNFCFLGGPSFVRCELLVLGRDMFTHSPRWSSRHISTFNVCGCQVVLGKLSLKKGAPNDCLGYNIGDEILPS